MIIHCDACGKAISHYFSQCLHCRSKTQPQKDRARSADMSSFFEDFSPTFERRVIG